MSHEPQTASSLEAEGHRAFREGRFLEAAQAFSQAEEQLRGPSDGPRAAQMANNRSVALLQAGKSRPALEAVQGTPEVFAAAGEKGLQAQALGNLAAALEAVGEPVQAEKRYHEALSLFERVGDDDSRHHTLRALSRLQLARGRPYEAAATLQEAMAAGGSRGLKARFTRWLTRVTGRLLGSG